MEGVIGIQVVNEAQWDPPGMYKFYDEALTKIAAIEPTVPVYISDAWDLLRALKYAQRKNNVKGKSLNPVIVDTHKYYTFAEKHTSRSPHELITQVSEELGQLDGLNGNVFDNKGEPPLSRRQVGWERIMVALSPGGRIRGAYFPSD
jgi:aryl-phospho-beta-D-glucosidase BglC (GH1 family)